MAESPYAIGHKRRVLYQMIQVEIDEQLMKEIAQNTDGKYFRATNNKKLKEIYEEINKLETSEIEEQKFYNYDEHFRPFIYVAGLLLLLEVLLKNTIFRSFI